MKIEQLLLISISKNYVVIDVLGSLDFNKTLENYISDNSTNEQALNFMKRMLRDYLKFEKGM